MTEQERIQGILNSISTLGRVRQTYMDDGQRNTEVIKLIDDKITKLIGQL
jgi:hypothetical protein